MCVVLLLASSPDNMIWCGVWLALSLDVVIEEGERGKREEVNASPEDLCFLDFSFYGKDLSFRRL